MNQNPILNQLAEEQLSIQRLDLFAKNVSSFLKELTIYQKSKDLSIDHVGVRFKNPADVDRIKHKLKTFTKFGEPLADEVVNGRHILIFELQQPLQFGPWQIPCIELPYPGSVHAYPTDGWEHIEVVVDSSATDLNQFKEDLKNRFPSLNIEKLQSDKQYSEASPTAEGEELPNPTISITNHHGTTIKFHPRSIQAVVASKRK